MRSDLDLCNTAHLVHEKRIRRLMRLMGLMLIYQKFDASTPATGHKIYPLSVDWASDITCIPMRCGFLYLVAIIDWQGRKGLA